MTMLEAALAYCDRGWYVIPCGKDPSEPKKPNISNWNKLKPTREQVLAWWAEWPDARIGLCLGESIVRIDADSRDAVERLKELLGEYPTTMEFATPSGGRGWLFSVSKPTPTAVLWTGGGKHEELRLQGLGSQTIVPPSPGYHWISDKELAPLPTAIDDIQLEQRRVLIQKELESNMYPVALVDFSSITKALQCVPAHDRKVWLDVGMALHTIGNEWLPAWIAWSQKSHKFVEGECEKFWAGFSRGRGISIGTLFHHAKQHGYVVEYLPLTSGGNAKMLANMGGHVFKHCAALGWLAWDDRRWMMGSDAEKLVIMFQRELLACRRRTVLNSIKKLDPASKEYEGLHKKKLQRLNKINVFDTAHWYNDARTLAAADDKVRTSPEAYNQQPFLFNFLNGTLDLRTGDLASHRQGDLITQLCPHNYNPNADRDVFDKYLCSSFPEADDRRMLKHYFGLCMIGKSHKRFLILCGPPDSGKTKLGELAMYAFGSDYADKAKKELLMRSRNTPDREMVKLYGRRFIACSETDQESSISVAQLKELTGQDTVAARFLYKETFSFLPTHDFLLYTNTLPAIPENDDATFARMLVLQLKWSFPPGHPERIENLDEVLKGCVEGFLAWCVEGCLEAGDELYVPESVKTATAEYRRSEDLLGTFISTLCEVGPEFSIRVAEFQHVYAQFVGVVERRKALDGRRLTSAMESKGFIKRKGGQYFEGLRLRSAT